MDQNHESRIGWPVLGLPPGVVVLHAYEPRWAELYRQEAEAIMGKMTGLIVAIEHVGSTSIPGMRAKPIIDILAGVRILDDALRIRPSLLKLGYLDLGDRMVENHRVFAKGTWRSHLLHVVQYQGPSWDDLLAFRDILRQDPVAAQEYETHKVAVADAYAKSRSSYMTAKGPFIDELIRRHARNVR